MGAGIALVAARAGFSVDLIEPDANTRERALEGLQKDPHASRRVALHAALPASSDAGLAIEAVPERLELKAQIFREFGALLGPQALLASNTSSLCVSEIAQAVEYPERVVGLHFFNPAPAMKLVEIVRARQTSDEALARARAYAERFGKTAVAASDTPGFIVNRVARPFYLQALRAYAAGLAPAADLDRLARAAGFRMGPFELMDLIGLDVNLATSESIYERTGAKRLEPVEVQRELVRAGRLGRKTGAGFYDYTKGPPSHDDGHPEPVEPNDEERVVVVGTSGLAAELRERLARQYAHVDATEDDDSLGGVGFATIAIDAGDGASDRSAIVRELDALLAPEAAIFVDAYATGVAALGEQLRHPGRVVGFGVLASLASQRAVEIVDAERTNDESLELAQELFASLGKSAVLVADAPGLFLGRTVASIVNEAVHAVAEGVASAQDVDLAMRLGTNYPIGPIAWGREIGGPRLCRILDRLAAGEGAAFAPHRELWSLDA